MRCLIVDDEPPAVRILERYVQALPGLTHAGSCRNAFEAMATLQEQEVDLLLLDINMPELSGISLVRSLPHPPLVIFTTAYPEFAVEGFEVEAVDYLVKPFPLERFAKAIQRARDRLPSSEGFLLVRAEKRLYRLPWDDLLYLQAYGDYVRIFTRKESLMTKETLTHLEQVLPSDRFTRIQRSYIVALAAIDYLEGNLVRVEGKKLPVGPNYRDTLLQLLKKDGNG